ncbi:hypothetical protein ACFE33_12865 [Falsihalocynthiibacter sp. SS001]|uniref:hypothetical protein n=1 Tax=Falsihalocynthiibacter sp. SS001 TaxID=3349698 RepID=UPI0036D37870
MSDKAKYPKSVGAAKALGSSAFFLAKVTGKAGLAIAKPVGSHASNLAIKGGQAVDEAAKGKIAEYKLRHADYTPENFYEKSATTLEDLVDAILIEKTGTSAKVVRTLSAKLGAAGATVGIFSIASLLGTASTGTAISSLSGAAFNSAALAWIGGSVATGGWIVLGAVAISSIAAYYGSSKLLGKWTGTRRKKKVLDTQEKQFVETCLMLATAFRERVEQKAVLDQITADALHHNLSQELVQQLDVCIDKVADWPSIPLNRLNNCKGKLEELLKALTEIGDKPSAVQKVSIANGPIMTGVVSATIMKLMALELPSFSDDEQLVLQALRRSSNSLADASDLDLSKYVQSLTVEQITGLKNNVKGIYHELAFQHRENLDGDEYIVELFKDTNHAGADVRIINVETGEVSEVQLKATNYATYVREHNEKYENIDVLITSEVAEHSSEFSSSGFSNEDLTADTTSTLNILDQGADAGIAESMGVAAMVTLAANAKSMLKGESLSTEAKEKIIQDGVVAASVAGLVQLIL